MNKLLAVMLLCLLGRWVAVAESTNASPAKAERTIERDIDLRDLTVVTLAPHRANEVVSGRLAYSGIAVEMFKSRHPWQLLNPFAPAKYSSPEDNLVRDPINRQVRGLKFLSIRF